MSERKLGNWEAITLVLTVILNHVILDLPKDIIQTTSSAAILNVVFISIVALGIVYLIGNLFKKFPGLDILDVSKFLGGKWFKIVMCILFLLYILSTVSILLRSFSEILKVIFFPRTPIYLIILLFLISIVFINRLKFNALARANLIFTVIALINILFIFVANIENFTWQRIYPILGAGASSTFFSGLSNLYAFSGITYLYLIPPYLKKQENFNKVALMSISVSAVCLLASVSTLLFMFAPIITTQEIFPMYLASRFIEFGRFFQRIDAVFIFIWLLSILCYLSIAFYFINSIFKKITSVKTTRWCASLFAMLAFGISLIPKNLEQISFFQSNVYKYAVIGLIFCISLAILVFANIKHLYIDRKGVSKLDENIH